MCSRVMTTRQETRDARRERGFKLNRALVDVVGGRTIREDGEARLTDWSGGKHHILLPNLCR